MKNKKDNQPIDTFDDLLSNFGLPGILVILLIFILLFITGIIFTIINILK